MTLHGVNSKSEMAYIQDGSGSGTAPAPSANIENKSIFSGVDGFDAWSGSIEAQDEFTMFGLNLSTYSKDLNNFAQSYINKYDADEDSNMNFEEFVQMASNGEQSAQLLSVASELYNLYKNVYEEQIIPQNDKDDDGALNVNEFLIALGHDPNTIDEQTRKDVEEVFNTYNTDSIEGNENQLLSADELLVGLNPTLNGIDSQTLKTQTEMFDLFNTQYSELNLNGDEQVSSEEFATMLYASDVDWEKYEATKGDVASSIDGKLNWENYQAYTSLNSSTEQGRNLLMQRMAFFDNFYGA